MKNDAAAWQAALIRAQADKAEWGAILYVKPDGRTIGRVVVNCGDVALAGLLATTTRELLCEDE
jgi:hypothetical protein